MSFIFQMMFQWPVAPMTSNSNDPLLIVMEWRVESWALDLLGVFNLNYKKLLWEKLKVSHIANVIVESMWLCQEDDSIGALSRPCLIMLSLFSPRMPKPITCPSHYLESWFWICFFFFFWENQTHKCEEKRF